jgi:hypothetical protein
MSEKTMPIEKSDIEWIKQELLRQGSAIRKLNDAIVGDAEFGQKGIVEKLSEHSKYIEKDKQIKQKVIGGIAVVGAIWTLFLKFWDKIF